MPCHTLRKMGSVYWHVVAGQTVFPARVAVRLKIPLIIWGVHQGCDQVGIFSYLDEVEMTRKYRKDHDLMGYEAEDLVDESEDFYHCIDSKRDARIWHRLSSGEWELKDSVINHMDNLDTDDVRLEKVEDCDFRITPGREPKAVEKDYDLIGRGWVDKDNASDIRFQRKGI